MSNNIIKQVIVVRTDLKNIAGQKIRTGKLFAQVSHASMSFITKRMINNSISDVIFKPVEWDWICGIFTKVCLQVNSEEELLDIYNKAKESELEVHLITDCGLTEFGGIPTKTCLAIGPDYSEKIDEITKHLKLY